MKLTVGSMAPAFTLPAVDGRRVHLSDFTGQRVLLYFYPAAMTPGCTKQACDFRDNSEFFTSSGLTLIGISPDEPAKLEAFQQQEGLTFTLLSDPEHTVMADYGAWGPKMLYGKTVTGVIRSTFIIDTTGNLELAQYNVKATGHVARIIREIQLT